MGKLARGLLFIDGLLLRINLFVCACLLLSMVVIVGLGVIFRFILHNSLSWSDELSAYLFVWLTCLGAAAGIKLRVHPEVRILAERCPPALAKYLADATDCAILALGAVFLAYGGAMLDLMGTETATSMPFSMAYPYLSIPVCGALLIFHSITHIAIAHLAPNADVTVPAHGISEHI